MKALLNHYAPPSGVADELFEDGALRPVWSPLVRHLATQSSDQLAARFARGDQYLHDAGVYYRQFTGPESAERDWPLSHVPVIISGDEWQGVADGIIQRAELLEQVAADLYGAGTMVRDGLLPAELVARNPEWLRPLVGVQPRSGHFLHFLAFEIGRSPDGGWFVLGDRTQAPSGAGFAIENRMATSRVFSELFANSNVERLGGFFNRFRSALNGLRQESEGRVGILTPGQHTDTYFEHAYIARHLGFDLLEGGDLKVENGTLTVRTIHGREPVGVLWRRLDSRFADPLELDETSALGTPGMVSALQSGAVAMVNCLGSGVLESRALMAFLPRICEQLTGAQLKLPNIATWWCGQEKERAFVLDNLDRMMIGPAMSSQLPFELGATTALGGKFRDTAQRPVAEWLAAEGGKLVGQEAVSLSTTPAMIDGKLVPRPMVVRVFAARTEKGWTVMPGGYARIGKTTDPTALAMQKGGTVADVWIVTDQPGKQAALTDHQAKKPFMRRLPSQLPARAADNLFWLGRYVERAEASMRLLRAYNRRLATHGPDALPLVEYFAEHLTQFGLSPDRAVPDGILDMLGASVACASEIRDQFSTDGWNALNDLRRASADISTRAQLGDDAMHAMSVLLRKTAGFSGLVHENMFRFSGWRFLTMGRALERADQIAATLIRFTAPDAPTGSLDVALEIGESTLAHRRRYSVESSRNTVVDLLALDDDNPRSILFQAHKLHDEERRLANAVQRVAMSDVERLMLKLQTDLAISSPQEMTGERLAGVRGELAGISDAITAYYLG
ncbi:hypothetical protein ATO10_09173 [Actibacterium atlanticum]|uniref:Uncharacterized protein n=1 Tax=Actibacterium atlanticum TaxID=1461693 RepID=A0A058ZMG4_9RHOB|nr:circularly permuted type 2 ATP-grasp protein [Actibacterium atlanticum]KCV82006.1 hypothetical protein ATO10_09173 [Actibacterium atlanticum]